MCASELGHSFRAALPGAGCPVLGAQQRTTLALLRLSVKKSLPRPAQLPRGDDASAFKGQGAAGPERRLAPMCRRQN